jgi:hypothetical protein
MKRKSTGPPVHPRVAIRPLLRQVLMVLPQVVLMVLRLPDHMAVLLQAPMAAPGSIPHLLSLPDPMALLPHRLPALTAHRLLLRDLMGPLLRQLARMHLPPLRHRLPSLRLRTDPKEDTIHQLPRASKPAMVLQLNRRTLRPHIRTNSPVSVLLWSQSLPHQVQWSLLLQALLINPLVHPHLELSPPPNGATFPVGMMLLMSRCLSGVRLLPPWAHQQLS